LIFIKNFNNKYFIGCCLSLVRYSFTIYVGGGCVWLFGHAVTAIDIHPGSCENRTCRKRTGLLILSGLKRTQIGAVSAHVVGDHRPGFRGFSALLVAIIFAVGALLCSVTTASAENRTLKLHNLHTGEMITVTFKRNGVFDPRALKELNVFLRDWRRNEPTKIDPRLFDLIWEVYQKTGSNEFISVVCGYRSPSTNSMLRSRSKMVAEKSQHILGKAMDYFIPGVNLAKLREIGIKMQVGGVGYYPNSGSPFVHMDVGGVRAWPKLSRDQLVRLFPDGKTMHIPSDGKPLPGYYQAVADYKRRVGSNSIEIADAGNVAPKKKGFFASLFGGGDETDDADSNDAPSTRVAAKAPSKPVVDEVQPILASANPSNTETEVAIVAPVPASRPAFAGDDSATQTALVSPTRSAAQDALSAAMPVDGSATTSNSPYVDLAEVNAPVPQLLGVRQQNGDAVLMASADANALPADMVIPVPGTRPDMPATQDQLAALTMMDNPKPVVPAEKPVEMAMLEAKSSAPVLTAAPVPAAPVASMTSLNPPVQPLVSADDAAQEEADAADDEDLAELAALDPASINRQSNDTDSQPLVAMTDGVAKKGSRPAKTRGMNLNATSAADAKLNQQVLAKWAISKGLVPKSTESQKSPRVVAQGLLTPPKAGETSGFKAYVANIDTQRFGDESDSQMDMSRFATN